MKHLIFSLILLYCAPLFSREYSLTEAEKNPALVNVLVLDQASNGPERLMKISSKLTFLKSVIFDQSTDTKQAEAYVSSVAACNGVRNIVFRNCKLDQMPSNMKMLVSVRSLEVQGEFPGSSEAFYNTAADMNSVEQVRVSNNDFRELPQSFSRMRVMKSIDLINTDQGLASGYDINTKLPEEMISSDTVKFGFGADVLAMSYTCYNKEACSAHLQMFRDVLQGAPRASNVFYKPAREKAFLKEHPLVKRPLKNADVIPDVFTTSSLTGGIAEYGSGTKIIVPPAAFVDANGKTVTGNVELTYREFRDPADIIVSGIPMKYDSGGVVGDFKSAGMFEMYASQNNQEVFVAPGKNIELQFAVTDTAPEYNFYRLDESKGWVYESSPGEVESVATTRTPSVDSIAPLSKAVAYYNDNIRKVNRGYFLGDTLSFESRYADTNYIGEHLVKVSARWSRAQKAKRFSRFYLRKYAGGKDFTCVRIERTRDNYVKNPELSAYKGYYWKLDRRMRGPELRKKYGNKSGISDIRIINDGGEFFIELKYYWGFDRIRATPVRLNSDRKPIDVNEIQKSRLNRNYTRHLNAQRRSDARKVSHKVRVFNRKKLKASADSANVYNRTIKYMDETESAMTRKQWDQYAMQENIRIYNAKNPSANSVSAVYQTLQISGMGIYNCDQVRRLTNPVTKVLKTITTNAGAIVPAVVYVVSKTANMVLSYFQGSRGGIEFSYGKKDVNSLVAVDKEGMVYVVDEEDFPNMADAGRDRVDMEADPVDGEPSNPEVIRRAIFPENYE
jgi:hypothetical protein